MTRPGFALLTVLWVLAAVTSGIALALATSGMGLRAGANRVALARGRWAAEACLAVAQDRWGTSRFRSLDTLDLGRSTQCAWRVDDPGARLNVNLADRTLLAQLFAAAGLRSDTAQALADRIGARRSESPFPNSEAVRSLPGFPDSVVPLLTTDGPGTIDLATAPEVLLESLPGLGREAVDLILSRRTIGPSLGSLDALVAALSPAGRAELLPQYADLSALLTYAPSRLVLTAAGWVNRNRRLPQATIEILVVPVSGHLATVRRRMW